MAHYGYSLRSVRMLRKNAIEAHYAVTITDDIIDIMVKGICHKRDCHTAVRALVLSGGTSAVGSDAAGRGEGVSFDLQFRKVSQVTTCSGLSGMSKIESHHYGAILNEFPNSSLSNEK